MIPAPPVRERLDPLARPGLPLRRLVAEPPSDAPTAPGPARPHVVVVPGLGALAYLLPTVRELARLGARCSLLDVPGFGSARGLVASPTVEGVGSTVARWLRCRDASEPVVLLGHSTGAQAALRAVAGGAPAGMLVLAGPTVAPGQRSLLRLVGTAPAAYRRDSLRELRAAPDYLRARTRLLPLLRSAVADRPEEHLARVGVPVLVTAGRQDAFAPHPWLVTLTDAATAAPWRRTVVLPGSHNNPFTHPAALARLVLAAWAATSRPE